MKKLEIKDVAPDFELADQNNVMHKLSDYKGNWVLLYFYPKDNTPGCTKEACSMRDNFPSFGKLNAKVFGISADSTKSHKKFADKYNLNFTLLSDESHKLLKKYGVWQKRKLMGREFTHVARWSFLVNPEGKIAKIYKKVDPKQHATEVLEDLKKFQGSIR